MSETVTATLSGFLSARIAEDEAEAERWAPGSWTPVCKETNAIGMESTHDGLLVDPARVLAECEAKRRIVERYDRACDGFKRTPNPGNAAGMYVMTEVLQMLALPYADHPDFREEWRP